MKKKIRLVLTAVLVSLAMGATACTSPTAVDDVPGPQAGTLDANG